VYVNRGTTGAVVARQPFGGWKRSSVGPTAKAGGANYVNCLRAWPEVHDVASAMQEMQSWWAGVGARANDDAALLVERNIVRYRRMPGAVCVRIDGSFDARARNYLEQIVALTGVTVELSAQQAIDGVDDVVLETVDAMVERCSRFARVRWLSAEVAPAVALLEYGLSTDPRPLAQSGAVEGPRWLREQSVAITNHRYGNVHAGPKPSVPGLGD
jgi:RHH-type proline utilization regulon transcriptional repressor/proline dehydrogenase/delta 1-pyrroline-5-carboxylate dehydrogenase